MYSGLRLYSPWAQTVTTVWAQTVTTAWAQTVQRGLRLLQSEPTLYSGLRWRGTNMKKVRSNKIEFLALSSIFYYSRNY